MQFLNALTKKHLFLQLLFISVMSYGQAPGGIDSDMVLWLKANLGLDQSQPVSNWTDQSSSGNNAIQTLPDNRPNVHSSAHNYNPSVYFNNQNNNPSEYLTLNDLIDPLSTGFSVIAVGTNQAGGDYWHAMICGQTNNEWVAGGFGLGYIETVYGFGIWVENWERNSTMSWQGNQAMPAAIAEGKFANDEIIFYLNTMQAGAHNYDGAVGDNDPTEDDTFLGAGGSPNNDNHLGYIAEVIVYTNPLSDPDRHKINSYLAIKYGITLSRYGVDDNYISSNSTSIYTIDSGDYWNNIIGIGRDDASDLLQKQSHEYNDNARIFLDDLQVDNLSNTGSIPNDQFVVMGNDAGFISVVIDSNAEKPASVFSRLDREWKVINTGFGDTYTIDVQLNDCVDISLVNEDDLRLLVDPDGDFTDAAVYDSNTGPDLTLNGRFVRIHDIPNSIFPTNETTYFTIGSINDVTLDDVFEARPVDDVVTCDINGNGIAEFSGFLVDVETQVIDGQADLTVSFFDDQGIEIFLTDPYTNTIPYNETITVRVTNDIGCYDETTFDLIVRPFPDIDTLPDVEECGSYELPPFTNQNNFYFTGPGGTGTEYQPGDMYDIVGITTLYIFADDGFCVNESSFTITINEMPAIDTSLADVTECGSYELPPLTDGSYYTESGGVGTELYAGDMITESQTIYVYAENGQCEDEYSFEVTIIPVYDFNLTLDNIIIDNQVDIQVIMENLPITYEYQVDGGDFQTENDFFGLAPGLHTLTVRDSDLCIIRTIDFWISLFTIPNFFTPNNDGYNDYWQVIDTDNTVETIQIFDRFGRLIATIAPDSAGWDGTVNNKPLPSSDYWYLIKIRTDDELIKGHFTLKR